MERQSINVLSKETKGKQMQHEKQSVEVNLQPQIELGLMGSLILTPTGIGRPIGLHCVQSEIGPGCSENKGD